MPVRNWGAGSQINVPANASADPTGDFSIAVKLKPLSFPSATQVLLGGVDSDGAERWKFGINASGVPYFTYFVASGGFGTITSTGGALTLDEWQIVGWSGIGFAGLRRFHIQAEDGTWAHSNGDLVGSQDPMVSLTGGHYIVGRNLNCSIAIMALWETWIDDTPFEDLGANDASLDFTTFTPIPVLALNFDQTTDSEQIPDLMGNLDTIVGGLTDVSTDPLGIKDVTVVDSTDLTWDFTVPPPPLDFELRFSGGSSNEDPLLSHGGAMSSTEALNPIPGFTRVQVLTGVTFYMLVYLFNNDNGNAADVEAYFSNIDVSSGVHVAMGVATEAAGTPVSATPDTVTAPAGVTFSTPLIGSPVTVDRLDPLEMKGIWLRVIIDDDSPGAIHNNIELTFDVVPL